MLLLLLLFSLAGCATGSSGPFLFPRGKQKHEIRVFGKDGQENSRSQSFLILEEKSARVTVLSPVALTLLKAELIEGQEPQLLYMNPVLEPQKGRVMELMSRLGRLFWAKGVPRDVQVTERFADQSARRLEWKIAGQRIVIEVEKI